MTRLVKNLFILFCLTVITIGAITNGGNARTLCAQEWNCAMSADNTTLMIDERTFDLDREVESVCTEEPVTVEVNNAYEPDMLLPRLFFWF